MSLNKTLDRLFDEIRREAKRNPDFADRLDAVLRLHDSRREVGDEVAEAVASNEPLAPKSPAPRTSRSGDPGPSLVESGEASARAQTMGPGSAPRLRAAGPGSDVEDQRQGALAITNPVALYKREGEVALAAHLGAHDVPALHALIAEHNLDPSGEAGALDREGLAAHVVAQAKRRAERDEKLFDY